MTSTRTSSSPQKNGTYLIPKNQRDSLEGVDPDQEAIEIPTHVESIPAPGSRTEDNYYMDLIIEED